MRAVLLVVLLAVIPLHSEGVRFHQAESLHQLKARAAEIRAGTSSLSGSLVGKSCNFQKVQDMSVNNLDTVYNTKQRKEKRKNKKIMGSSYLEVGGKIAGQAAISAATDQEMTAGTINVNKDKGGKHTSHSVESLEVTQPLVSYHVERGSDGTTRTAATLDMNYNAPKSAYTYLHNAVKEGAQVPDSRGSANQQLMDAFNKFAKGYNNLYGYTNDDPRRLGANSEDLQKSTEKLKDAVSTASINVGMQLLDMEEGVVNALEEPLAGMIKALNHAQIEASSLRTQTTLHIEADDMTDYLSYITRVDPERYYRDYLVVCDIISQAKQKASDLEMTPEAYLSKNFDSIDKKGFTENVLKMYLREAFDGGSNGDVNEKFEQGETALRRYDAFGKYKDALDGLFNEFEEKFVQSTAKTVEENVNVPLDNVYEFDQKDIVNQYTNGINPDPMNQDDVRENLVEDMKTYAEFCTRKANDKNTEQIEHELINEQPGSQLTELVLKDSWPGVEKKFEGAEGSGLVIDKGWTDFDKQVQKMKTDVEAVEQSAENNIENINEGGQGSDDKPNNDHERALLQRNGKKLRRAGADDLVPSALELDILSLTCTDGGTRGAQIASGYTYYPKLGCYPQDLIPFLFEKEPIEFTPEMAANISKVLAVRSTSTVLTPSNTASPPLSPSISPRMCSMACQRLNRTQYKVGGCYKVTATISNTSDSVPSYSGTCSCCSEYVFTLQPYRSLPLNLEGLLSIWHPTASATATASTPATQVAL